MRASEGTSVSVERACEGHESAFSRLGAEWREIQRNRHTTAGHWETKLHVLRAEEGRLRDSGSWVHGRSDYLGVLGRHRDELAHSRMLAWLLDPCARHGLGTRVLAGVLRHASPDATLPLGLERVNVFTEVVLGDGRLDIVVDAPSLYLVIENKVDAHEGEGQCAYYVEHVQRADARFMLLSPDGRGSRDTPEFTPLRFSQVAQILAAALRDAPDASDLGGRRIASDYLDTLRMEFR